MQEKTKARLYTYAAMLAFVAALAFGSARWETDSTWLGIGAGLFVVVTIRCTIAASVASVRSALLAGESVKR